MFRFFFQNPSVVLEDYSTFYFFPIVHVIFCVRKLCRFRLHTHTCRVPFSTETIFNLLRYILLRIIIIFFYLYWYSYIRRIFLFVTQLPSLERWALLPFLGFSYPNLLLVFLNLLLLGTCIICFFASVGLSLGLFNFILFFCTLFWVSV